jgi:hypothetical protein
LRSLRIPVPERVCDSIVDGADRKIPRSRKPSFSEPISNEGYEATVASMSRAAAALSREVATAIRDLSAN